MPARRSAEIAAGLETEVGLAIAAERAVKEELAIAEVPVAPAIVEGRVIEVAARQSKSPEAVVGPVEAAPEAGPAPLKASIAVVAQRVAPASAAAPAGEALAAVGQGRRGRRRERWRRRRTTKIDWFRGRLSGFGLEKWNTGTMERGRMNK